MSTQRSTANRSSSCARAVACGSSGTKARRDIGGRARHVPIAREYDIACGAQLGTEIEQLHLEPALVLVAIAARLARVRIDVRFRGAVDGVEIDDREAIERDHHDPAFAIPRRHGGDRLASDVGRDPVRAAAAKLHVAWVIRERVVAGVARQELAHRRDVAGVAGAYANLLQAQHVWIAQRRDVRPEVVARREPANEVLDVPRNDPHVSVSLPHARCARRTVENAHSRLRNRND